jgi:hypothetical protein
VLGFKGIGQPNEFGMVVVAPKFVPLKSLAVLTSAL